MAQSPAAIAALYELHAGTLYRYALAILADSAAAEDAVQEMFCRLAKILERRPEFVPAPSYLRAAVRNECFSILRRRRPYAAGPLLEPVSMASSEEERLQLESALCSLPPEQREVVHLKVFEGMTFQEIATATGVGINTAASRYRYAMDALRRAFDGQAATKDAS